MQNLKNLEDLNKSAFDQLYTIDTIIELTKKTCQDCEFNAYYNGIPADMAIRLSTERNHYLNMLNILSEKIKILLDINQEIESELTLHQNTNNCS